jgi:predicted metal-dependent phosphoesterase TrpH
MFSNGATWLRADFHLHTKADREFKYSGDENFYCSAYVEALKNAGISVGVIANHNKFDCEEFKALCKTARKKDIFLLPGVELSVNDGANGIHTILVFSKNSARSPSRRSSSLSSTMKIGCGQKTH